MALTPQFGSLVPSQTQQLLATNYLQWTNNGGGAGIPANFSDFAAQYLPEIYEQEVERYGNRTLSGFLRMVGAELPMTSDQVIWSEQNRLHIAYDNCTFVSATGVVTLNPAADPNINNVISPNATVVIMDDFGAEAKCFVSASTPGAGAGATITVQPYTAANLAGAGLVGVVKVFVYGSEYAKGSLTPNNTAGAGVAANGYVSVTPSFTQFSNNPLIIRSKYTVNGSDTAQIGWVEVATEDGTGGYLWYLKAESETRLRFEDYLEMMCVEGEIAAAGSAALANGQIGTQGMFAAIQARGNVQVGFSAATGISDFDDILRNLDTQGAIEENMLFLDRQTALDFDDMLAGISAGFQGGTAYGLFENSEEMALNLGFSGFRRGSYDFYKTDWKYLNDASTRGGMTGPASIEGVLIPAGTTTVYDQILGTNIRRPFLHVRYRASQADDRRMKSWLTGSVGGAFTSDLDAMEVNFLSERCLVTQAANNFVLFQGV
jgi:hypothetical protein|tara:strand:- start:14055 stop:15524 length:1470 start_codon:yes stop_codon:yes gene_type:complete